jgi:hypothetical protein
MAGTERREEFDWHTDGTDLFKRGGFDAAPGQGPYLPIGHGHPPRGEGAPPGGAIAADGHGHRERRRLGSSPDPAGRARVIYR